MLRPETIKKIKRQPSEWEKIIANEATDKGLVSKIHKQTLTSMKDEIHSNTIIVGDI